MQVRIIGHPELRTDDGQIIKLARQLNQALAVLVIAAVADPAGRGRISAERLKAALWEDAGWTDRTHSLRGVLSKLRKQLGEDRIPSVTETAQIILRPSDYVDLRVFRARVANAEKADRIQDDEVAATLLSRAVGMWEDAPLTALPDTAAMAPVRTSLLLEYQQATAAYVRVRLRLGHHQQLSGEIPEWLARDPLNEVLAGQYMTALYRSGRKPDALGFYSEFTEQVREATGRSGAEPGPDLQRIASQIEHNDPDLDWEPLAVRPTDAAVLASGADPRFPLHSRVLAYQLGNSHNLAVDRVLVEDMLAIAPTMNEVPRANEEFFARAVEYAVTELGVKQFLEFGTGTPSQYSPHVVARRFLPDAPVVYVTGDITVEKYAAGSLTEETTGIFYSNMRDPAKILHAAETRRLIDFDSPLAVIFRDALNYIPTHYDPGGLIRGIMQATVPGSVLILSNGTSEGMPDVIAEQLAATFANAPQPLVVRTREEIEAFFDGFRMVDPAAEIPGVVRVDSWNEPRPPHDLPMLALGGVAIRD